MTAVQKLSEMEQSNLSASLERIGDSIEIIERVHELHDLVGEIFKEHGEPTDDVAIALHLMPLARADFGFAVLSCLRGHLTNSHIYLRRSIECAAWAARMQRSPKSRDAWMDYELTSKKATKLIREFQGAQMFPSGDPNLSQLKDRWGLSSALLHPSKYALARNTSHAMEESTRYVRTALCEITDGDHSEPAATLLWIVDTHTIGIKVFAGVFRKAISPSQQRWQDALRNVEGALEAEKIIWRDRVERRLKTLKCRLIETESGLLVPPSATPFWGTPSDR